MTSKAIGVFEAKTRLSELLDKVSQGQVYVISRRGRAIAELRPVSGGATLAFACDAGRVAVHDDFDAPLPDFDAYTR